MHNYEDFCDHCHRTALVIRHDPGVKRPYLETPVCGDGSLLGSCLVWELERLCHLFSVVKNEGAGSPSLPHELSLEAVSSSEVVLLFFPFKNTRYLMSLGRHTNTATREGSCTELCLWDNFILNTSHQSSLITGTDQGSAGPPPVFSHSPGTMPEPNNVAFIPLAETL